MLGAAVAALLFATPAIAQETAPASCGAIEAAPTGMPDGAEANIRAVNAYTERFNAWADANAAVLTCKRERADAARAHADALTTEWNTENGARRAAIAAWQVEVDEFNARNQGARRPGGDPRSREN